MQADGRVLASFEYVMIARSNDARFVGRLYAAGALLVLDADQAGGCSGLPLKRVAAQLWVLRRVLLSERVGEQLARIVLALRREEFAHLRIRPLSWSRE